MAKVPSFGQVEGGAALVLVGVVLFILYKGGAAKVLGRVTQPGALNPGSANNVVYGGVNAIGAAASGDASWNLGGWFYDLTHPSAGNGGAPAPTTGLSQPAQVATDNSVYDANDARAQGRDQASIDAAAEVLDANDARAKGLDQAGLNAAALHDDQPDPYHYTAGA